MVWFITEVLPLIDQLMDAAPRVFLVGRANAPRIKALESTRIILVGEVDNVRPWYESCRIFVAPTRFAAGIPLKVCEAGAGGIPVVATDLVFAQLGWSGRPEFRSGTSAEDFAEACVEVYTNETLWNAIRDAELELVEEVFSRAVFDRQLRLIFEAPDATPENGDSGSFNRLRGMRARATPPERLRTPSDASVLEAPFVGRVPNIRNSETPDIHAAQRLAGASFSP